MTTRNEPWPAGTPCWVDLMTSDLAAAKDFYSGLFGWTFADAGPEYGGYGMAMIGDRAVAGIGPIDPDQPMMSSWTTCLATDDADKTAELITSSGGTIFAPVMEVGSKGRLAIAADPTGATFGIWQAGDMIGAQLTAVPSTMIWCECLTSDPSRARDFYSAVFEYAYGPVEFGGDYTTIILPGGDTDSPVGGIGELDSPGDQPAWRIYFGANDVDMVAGEALAAGGRVITEPTDSEYGRWAHLADPQGARFSINSVSS